MNTKSQILVSIPFLGKKSSIFTLTEGTTSLLITSGSKKSQIYTIRLFNSEQKRNRIQYFYFNEETSGFYVDVSGYKAYQIERKSVGLKAILKLTEIKSNS